ncbi:hypothetical protein TWF696_007919 [Orbilia brochopaga]|uniref:C2H2-type domain-containing protein n=1 Tax=Orbilia brochopaga TaxID=3140254 RepID=A0AAV9UN22_9PEZI
MSLLDQDVPSLHTCSRCSMLFGHGQAASRGRHAHERDLGPLGDGPRKVTIYVNPSKRPYVAPFRRVQTLERLMQYISTLPHPQIRFVTNANPSKPKFKACEELLFAGQWQLVDKSGCIIRPEDWEELVHDGMDITVDTMSYEPQVVEERPSLLQPMALSGRKDVSVAPSQFGSMEVAGDLMEIQTALDTIGARQHVEATAPRFNNPSRLFVPHYHPEPEPLALELAGEESLEPQAPQPNTFVMPPKPESCTSKKQSMSPSATEFKPGGGFSSTSTIEPDDNPIFRLRKRSMAIPIIKPPSPPETIIAAPKPDMPDGYTLDTHEQEEAVYAQDTCEEAVKQEETDGWGRRVAVTAELTEEPARNRIDPVYTYEDPADEDDEEEQEPTEEVPAKEAPAQEAPRPSVQVGEWDGAPSTYSSAEASYPPTSTNDEEATVAPPSEQEEVASVSETVVASSSKPEERSAPSHSELNTEDEATTQVESSKSPSVGPESKFEGENHLFDDSPAVGDQEPQQIEPDVNEVQQHDVPIIVTEPPADPADDGVQALQELEYSVQKPPVIMATSGGSSRAELESEPRLRSMDFRWSEEPYEEPAGDGMQQQAPADQWGEAPGWDSKPDSGWNDWSTPATAPGYGSHWEAQWDTRGHVPLPEDNDSGTTHSLASETK